MTNNVTELLPVLLREGKRRLVLLTTIFSVVAVIGLGVGLALPKKYDASTLLVAEPSAVKPLVDRTGAGNGNMAEQLGLVTQVVMSRKIMREVLAFGGWLDPQPDPREQEKRLLQLRSRVKIEAKDELIRISYQDSDPERTFKVANKLSEIYIRECTETKERESKEAFEFLDKQVRDYEGQLTEAHEKVLAYYRGGAALPAAASTSAAPIVSAPPPPPPAPVAVAPRPASSISADELAQLRAEETTLLAQLGQLTKKAPPPAQADPQAGDAQAARARVNQVQSQLDQLLATRTEDHPDVKRVRGELAAAQAALARAEQAKKDRDEASAKASAFDDDVASATRRRLEDVQRKIAATTGTPAPSPRAAAPAPRPIALAPGAPPILPPGTPDPELRGVGKDVTLSELLRRYESIRDVYQDLLKRRETARVAMELETQHRGFTVRVQDPAEMPVGASGLRIMHLALIGLVVAVLVPFGILFALVRFDSRVKSAQQIPRIAKVPLLVSIGYAPPPTYADVERKRKIVALALIAGVFAVYVAAFVIKSKLSS
jgi:uncharacterized protein involved in exopolysaccharide biosynthesis